ncbi:MAG TPA: response regulator, partial [Holophaga sp.]|nr:response regulator [Holophaga sp.]
MPRLLLVDDNQRIHQIVETLLAATDIELTCAASGAEALELASAGGYDVALVDTTMQGMDGWELLERLRAAPATARMPIAMMAGVLDVVDPERVDRAPIQGFLKKPVELRDLADRVRTLMATPVPAPAGDILATVPHLKLADHPLPEASDILLLEPGDVLEEPAEEPFVGLSEEPAAEPSPEAMPGLELEELDLESLKGLALEPPAPPAPEAVPEPEPAMEAAAPAEDFMEFTAEDAMPDLGPALDVPEPALPEMDREPGPFGDPTPVNPLPADWSDESDTLLDLGAEAPWTAPAPAEAPADP